MKRLENLLRKKPHPSAAAMEMVMLMAILEDGGVRAIFGGQRYVLLPEDHFQVNLTILSIEREITLWLNDEQDEVDAIASFSHNSLWQIEIMGIIPKELQILVIFTTLAEHERENWDITAEQKRRWPCRLDYETSKWRLVIDMPPATIAKLAEIAPMPGTTSLSLLVNLSGLYVSEGLLSADGRPRGAKVAYMLPSCHWLGKTPKLYGYASQIVAKQHLFNQNHLRP